MKKSLLPITLALIIVLSSCSSPATNKNEENANSASAGAWNSEGGAFKQIAYDVPEGAVSVYANGSEVYGVISTVDSRGISLKVFHNADVIYAPGSSALIYRAAAAPEGVWIIESLLSDGTVTIGLKLISSSGEVKKAIPLNEEMDKDVLSILYNSGKLYLNTGSEVIVLSDNGKKLSSHKLPINSRVSLINGNDGKAYVVCYFDDSVEISSVDEAAIQSVLTLQTPDIKVFGGGEEFCFIMSNSEGLFGLNVDGTKTPALIWKDCGIPVIELQKVVALPRREISLLGCRRC